MQFDPEIWGPHYWFFLHTIAQSYPLTPNNITKRKYYDLISNLPLFIPDPEIGNRFIELLDKYPVTPYLDNRDSFIRWMHFIHNKINIILGKEEISLLASLDKYKSHYRYKSIRISERLKIKIQYIYMAIIFILLFLIYVYW
jgi:hypothetical protein